MSIWIDRITRQRVVYDKRSGDITYDLIGDDAIAKEDVPLIGPWTDWTGSNLNIQTFTQMRQPGENSLFGTDPQITDNAKVPNLSVIGTRVGTHRRRIVKRYLSIDGK
jgi:hypothetical protein